MDGIGEVARAAAFAAGLALVVAGCGPHRDLPPAETTGPAEAAKLTIAAAGCASSAKANPRAAVERCETACRADVVSACVHLGSVLASGSVGPKNLERAAQLWDRACKRDDAAACDALARAYALGEGVRMEDRIARTLLEKACNLGAASACGHLARAYEVGGAGLSKDAARASALRARACELGEGASCLRP